MKDMEQFDAKIRLILKNMAYKDKTPRPIFILTQRRALTAWQRWKMDR